MTYNEFVLSVVTQIPALFNIQEILIFSNYLTILYTGWFRQLFNNLEEGHKYICTHTHTQKTLSNSNIEIGGSNPLIQLKRQGVPN